MLFGLQYKEINVVNAEGLDECRKMMMVAKAGKYDGYLLEGMACPGGCIAGAGTVQPIAKSAAAVAKHKRVSTNAHAYQSDYKELLDIIAENDLKSNPK